MVYYEQIDRLQKQYTDKYVVVDESRPELRRFAGQTGIVKTVNMNGRALVQFDAFNNIGWYDIDPAFLRVVDAPLPKPEAKKEKAAPSKGEKAPPNAAEKPSAAAKPAAAAKSAAPAPKAGGSVADILAAARGGAKAAPAKPAEAASAPSPATAAKPAAANPKGMSVADVLAAARGKSAPATAPKTEAPKPTAPAAVEAPPVEAQEEQPIVAAAASVAPAAGSKRSKRNQITAISEMVAYCRATDAG